jgi:hypothetical protein
MTRLKDIKNSRRRRVSGKQKNGLGCLGCFGIIWMLFVLGFDGFIGYGFWRTYDARARFLTTPGVVTGSEIERSSGSDGTTYEAKIEYEFELGGTSYTGDRHSFFSFGTSSSEHASEVVRRYPVGKRVTVYYDPGEPEQSVLEVDTRSFPWFAIIFLTPFHCIGIGFVVGGVLQVVQRRRLGEDHAALTGLVVSKHERPGERRLVLADAHWAGWVIFVFVLGVTSFIAVFVVALGFGVDASLRLVLGVWSGCVSAALLWATIARLKRGGTQRHLEIDWNTGRFTRKPDSIGIQIGNVRTIRLESRDTGTQVNKQPWLTHTLWAIDDGGGEHLLLVAKGYASRGNELRDWFAARFEAASEGSADEDTPSMLVVSEVEINRTNS